MWQVYQYSRSILKLRIPDFRQLDVQVFMSQRWLITELDVWGQNNCALAILYYINNMWIWLHWTTVYGWCEASVYVLFSGTSIFVSWTSPMDDLREMRTGRYVCISVFVNVDQCCWSVNFPKSNREQLMLPELIASWTSFHTVNEFNPVSQSWTRPFFSFLKT